MKMDLPRTTILNQFFAEATDINRLHSLPWHMWAVESQRTGLRRPQTRCTPGCCRRAPPRRRVSRHPSPLAVGRPSCVKSLYPLRPPTSRSLALCTVWSRERLPYATLCFLGTVLRASLFVVLVVSCVPRKAGREFSRRRLACVNMLIFPGFLKC